MEPLYAKGPKGQWSFCFVLLRWLQMIEKIEDWFVIIGFIWKICIIWYHLRAIIQKLEFSLFWLCILKLFCWFLFRFVEMIADDWRLICDNRIHLKDLSSYIICIIHVRSIKVEVFYVFSMYFKAVLLVFVEMIGKIEEINFAIRLHLKRFCIIFVFIFFIYAKVPKGPPCFAGVI